LFVSKSRTIWLLYLDTCVVYIEFLIENLAYLLNDFV
jgi:hypothetical protein